jgi:phytoene synthase
MPQFFASDSRVTPLAEMAACRELLQNGSQSFFAASLLLPREVRDPATVLYAFCRIADDAVDFADDPAEAVAALHERLDAIYANRPLQLVDRALAGVVRRHGLPRAAFEALFEGFAWDAGQRPYETLDDLLAYGVRVAGTVGVMMTVLMGVRAPQALARANDLGVAMQLTNIARDVGEDARNGRLYLPRAWLRAEGLDPDAWLANPVFDHRIGAVVRRLLAEAEALYSRAAHGIPQLPPGCRPAIRAARLIYREIGRAVERQGYDSVSRRAYVPKGQKLVLVARACVPLAAETGFQPLPLMAQAAELIDSVRMAEAAGFRAAIGAAAPEPCFRDKAVAAIALFERMEIRGFPDRHTTRLG